MINNLPFLFGILFCVTLTGCGGQTNMGENPVSGKEMIVGTDIGVDEIYDFYYTEENINYDAYYQRYRFYVEDGKHLFFHETRERKDDYGPCTEEDTTLIGTIELTDNEWYEFTELVSGGTVRAREESTESGGTGPWLYLYWTNDESKYQQFSFDTYGKEKEFEEFCLSLVPEAENKAEDRFTGEQAIAGIKNYCYYNDPDLGDIVEDEEYPVYWEVESIDEEKIVILYRSYTGAQIRYYIDPISGETYVTEFAPGITDGEERTDENFCVRDYLE